MEKILLVKSSKNVFQNAYFALIVMIRKNGTKSPFSYSPFI